MIKKVEGIVVSEVDYGETSKIINVLTKTEIIGIYARGCKRPKSKLNNVTSKLTYGQFHINYKEKGLSTLIEVDIVNSFINIRKDMYKLSYSLYLLELAYNVFKQEENEEIYINLVSALNKINDGINYYLISMVVCLKYLDYLGIKPVLDSCIVCGSCDVVTVSSYKGGCLCKDHLDNENALDEYTIKLIRALYYVNIDEVHNIDIPSHILKQMREFIDDYYDRYSGIYLKTREFLRKVNKDEFL